MNPVQLLYANAGMTPSGMGSYYYVSHFSVVVDNLDYHKVVGIWGHPVGASTWSFYPCSYLHSVPGNKEIWHISPFLGEKIDQFVVSYEVAGQHYWDNNSGHNYLLDVKAAEQEDGIGTAVIFPPLLGESSGSIENGNLSVYVAVQNLDYQKRVAIIYSTDGWQTWNTAFGSYQESYQPGPLPNQAQVETWKIQVPIGVSQKAEYAIFYIVRNNTYWDNNFGLNYQAYTERQATASEDPGRTARQRIARAASSVRTALKEPAQT